LTSAGHKNQIGGIVVLAMAGEGGERSLVGLDNWPDIVQYPELIAFAQKEVL